MKQKIIDDKSFRIKPTNQKVVKVKSPVEIDTVLINCDQSRIIDMAWEDKTSFDDIERLYGFNEYALLNLLKTWLFFCSYKLCRNRVRIILFKHLSLI